MLRASVIVCTFNRCDLLEGCLASLVAQNLSPSEYEVVVVDNGSTDKTHGVVERWMNRAENIRFESEPATGLSRARNAGIRRAKGEVVAFLDDDAVATERWLGALLGAYSRWPGIGAVMGPVRLAWPGERPSWLSPAMERWFSGLDLGREPRLLKDGEAPFGTNMSIRRDALNVAGGFAVELGRKGTRLISNEERELFSRLRHSGFAVAYEPGAAVWHRVMKDRLSTRWLIRRGYAQGRSDVALERLRRRWDSGHAAPSRGRAVRLLLGATIRGWPKVVTSLVPSDNRARILVAQSIRRAQSLGYAREALLPSLTPGGAGRGPGLR
jgi:glucosyl-dolichyl phosphate glucuronosyltransferase